jgi:hypothetical protein
LLLVLVKLWGWIQMNRYAIQREIKRLELRIIELRGPRESRSTGQTPQTPPRSRSGAAKISQER